MVNRVTLLGALGQDPELKATGNGTSVCNFSVATSERWKDANGNKQENTTWHRIVAWGKLADICAQMLNKGDKVYLEGKISNRKWKDQEGKDRYTTEIVASEMKCLTFHNKEDNKGEQEPRGDREGYGGGTGGAMGTGDDVPFAPSF